MKLLPIILQIVLVPVLFSVGKCSENEKVRISSSPFFTDKVAQTSADKDWEDWVAGQKLGKSGALIALSCRLLTHDQEQTFWRLFKHFTPHFAVASKKRFNFSIRSSRSSKKCDRSPPLSTIDLSVNLCYDGIRSFWLAKWCHETIFNQSDGKNFSAA